VPPRQPQPHLLRLLGLLEALPPPAAAAPAPLSPRAGAAAQGAGACWATHPCYCCCGRRRHLLQPGRLRRQRLQPRHRCGWMLPRQPMRGRAVAAATPRPRCCSPGCWMQRRLGQCRCSCRQRRRRYWVRGSHPAQAPLRRALVPPSSCPHLLPQRQRPLSPAKAPALWRGVACPAVWRGLAGEGCPVPAAARRQRWVWWRRRCRRPERRAGPAGHPDAAAAALAATSVQRGRGSLQSRGAALTRAQACPLRWGKPRRRRRTR